MSTKSVPDRQRRRGPGHESAQRFVALQTRVPPEVAEHYQRAARRKGVSLSLYFEMLAKVDPLAASDQDDEAVT